PAHPPARSRTRGSPACNSVSSPDPPVSVAVDLMTVKSQWPVPEVHVEQIQRRKRVRRLIFRNGLLRSRARGAVHRALVHRSPPHITPGHRGHPVLLPPPVDRDRPGFDLLPLSVPNARSRLVKRVHLGEVELRV